MLRTKKYEDRDMQTPPAIWPAEPADLSGLPVGTHSEDKTQSSLPPSPTLNEKIASLHDWPFRDHLTSVTPGNINLDDRAGFPSQIST